MTGKPPPPPGPPPGLPWAPADVAHRQLPSMPVAGGAPPPGPVPFAKTRAVNGARGHFAADPMHNGSNRLPAAPTVAAACGAGPAAGNGFVGTGQTLISSAVGHAPEQSHGGLGPPERSPASYAAGAEHQPGRGQRPFAKVPIAHGEAAPLPLQQPYQLQQPHQPQQPQQPPELQQQPPQPQQRQPQQQQPYQQPQQSLQLQQQSQQPQQLQQPQQPQQQLQQQQTQRPQQQSRAFLDLDECHILRFRDKEVNVCSENLGGACRRARNCPFEHMDDATFEQLRVKAVGQGGHSIQYTCEHSVLVFGDGDLSWSRSLCERIGTGARIVATTYEPQQSIEEKYARCVGNAQYLLSSGATVAHGVDATHPNLSTALAAAVRGRYDEAVRSRFDRVIFNFPHTDVDNCARNADPDADNIKMLSGVFKNVASLLAPGGEFHLTFMMKPPYISWGIHKLAKVHASSLGMPTHVRFDYAAWPGYFHRHTNRDLSAVVNRAKTWAWPLKRGANPEVQVGELPGLVVRFPTNGAPPVAPAPQPAVAAAPLAQPQPAAPAPAPAVSLPVTPPPAPATPPAASPALLSAMSAGRRERRRGQHVHFSGGLPPPGVSAVEPVTRRIVREPTPPPTLKRKRPPEPGASTRAAAAAAAAAASNGAGKAAAAAHSPPASPGPRPARRAARGGAPAPAPPAAPPAPTAAEEAAAAAKDAKAEQLVRRWAARLPGHSSVRVTSATIASLASTYPHLGGESNEELRLWCARTARECRDSCRTEGEMMLRARERLEEIWGPPTAQMRVVTQLADVRRSAAAAVPSAEVIDVDAGPPRKSRKKLLRRARFRNTADDAISIE